MPMLMRAGIFVFFLLMAGCGSPHRSEPVARLEGKVTINGQPLPEDAVGSVIFRPRVKGQAPATEAKIHAGRYQTDKAPLGDITVFFHISRATGKIIKETPNDEHPHPDLQDLVPDKSQSGVSANVTGDNPQLDFDLRD
ncbi:MAG: hypothetical protein ABSG53_08665 [Thermoguttaceae bacterium]